MRRKSLPNKFPQQPGGLPHRIELETQPPELTTQVNVSRIGFNRAQAMATPPGTQKGYFP
jgi:hypothetical protein